MDSIKKFIKEHNVSIAWLQARLNLLYQIKERLEGAIDNIIDVSNLDYDSGFVELHRSRQDLENLLATVNQEMKDIEHIFGLTVKINLP